MANQEHITDVVKPYDWTYSTKYNGTNLSTDKSMVFSPTTSESIDIEQLKKPDPILFYDENILFEDELADNGTAVLTTKVVRILTLMTDCGAMQCRISCPTLLHRLCLLTPSFIFFSSA